MTNLFDYLTGKVVKKKKGKKITRRRRTRWGERMGKAAKESNNKKDSKIEKLLDILIARSAPTNTIELARMKQIEGDFQLAQDLQQKELLKSKGKKIEEEQPKEAPKETFPVVAESPITSVDRQHRFQAYQKEFNSLEEGYEGLLETLQNDIGESSVITGGAMSDFIARKEQLNANRNVLRKDLLEDIKNNPSEVWEWRGFIEQSENETARLLDLDNKVSQILYDQAMRNISEREALSEQQVAQAEENKKLIEEQLRQTEVIQEKERAFTEQLLEQNEKITEQKLQLVKDATEKEELVEELDKTQKFLSKKISETFDKGKETLQTKYMEGEGGLDFAKKADFKIALGQTGLEESWGEITRYYQQPQQRKEALNRKLVEKIKEQEQFLPKKIEGLMGALPPGSVMLQRESSLESLSPSRSPPRIEVEQSE